MAGRLCSWVLNIACNKCSYSTMKRQPPHRGGFRGFLETKFPNRPMPPGAIDLLERMLRLDPKKRISAMEAFKARLPPHVVTMDYALLGVHVTAIGEECHFGLEEADC